MQSLLVAGPLSCLALSLFSKDLVIQIKREIAFPVVQLLALSQGREREQYLIIALGCKKVVLCKIWKLYL